ncbi:MAG: SigB/SigF/SigG family RNA polymerase sigma factor [Clostridia bacterium]|nr:SigB/SigF/SigG family RNA polymerase sigma factor [Clostridia bacterium]MBQ8772758.1 SigB/SigF/SigG family RNA polymerase sigma factor [Clostridia bacterium]
MISHEETMCLIEQAQNGSEKAFSTLVTENTPLLKSIIRRYLGKHIEYDDLFQIAAIGLIKAVKNFSKDYSVRFSTYAVPMILGEIKRYMRDEGYLKVSRSLKTLSGKITKYIEERIKQDGTNPTIDEIAQHFGIEQTEIVFALDATRLPVSLYETTNDADGKQTELIEHIPTEEDKNMIQKIMLKDMLSRLPIREQKIVILRYFRDMTQSEIAKQMGVSQVQISRLENKILEKLKQFYNE